MKLLDYFATRSKIASQNVEAIDRLVTHLYKYHLKDQYDSLIALETMYHTCGFILEAVTSLRKVRYLSDELDSVLLSCKRKLEDIRFAVIWIGTHRLIKPTYIN